MENNEVADLYFETVTSEDSENVIGWTLYGMTRKKNELWRWNHWFYLAIFLKHIGNETNAQITLGQADKLQRAILKVEEEQAAAVAQLASPSSEEKREDDDKDRIVGEDKGEFWIQIS